MNEDYTLCSRKRALEESKVGAQKLARHRLETDASDYEVCLKRAGVGVADFMYLQAATSNRCHRGT
jgi:hypothetical protein